MKKSTIPTILGLFILIVSIVSILVIIKAPQIFKSSANANLIPRDLRITNIKDNSLTVSYFTDIPSIGFVKYSSSNGVTQTSPTSLSKIHYINIQNLTSGTDYSIAVNSGGEFFPDLEKKVQTLSSYLPSASIVSGKILDKNKLPAKDVLVYVAIEGVIKNSALTSLSGNWIVSLPQISETSILQILAVSTDGGQTGSQIDLKSANPTPTMTIGESYDFRNQTTTKTDDIPSLEIPLP